MKGKITILFLVFLVITLSACNNSKPFKSELYAMGTLIDQVIYGKNAKITSKEVSKKIKTIERQMTVKLPGGDVDKINKNATKSAVVVDREILNLIKSSIKISKLSNGAFDITILPIVNLWGIGTDKERIPSDSEIKKLLPLVNYRDIVIDDEKSSVFLKKENQKIDLGGIAKGYAGDVAIGIYKNQSIKKAIINLGGNVVTLGSKVDNQPWTIGIQNPREKNGVIIGTVKVSNKAVVSSGDYERYFEKNGVRYHHIIDPKTGKPARSGLISSTIIAKSSTEADGLSTATFILGLDEGMKLIRKYKNDEAIFVTYDKKVYTTDGLNGIFEFKDDSGEYKYVKKR